MEFFDKKQDVIDLQITRYGRHLLSRGLFNPVYYCFSDDEIIYDRRWISGTTVVEEQSAVEERIQEDTARLKTLNAKANAELTVFNASNNTQLQNLIDLYNINTDMIQMLALEANSDLRGGPEEELFKDILNSIVQDVDFAESEKLLNYKLGTKRYFNDRAPAWNVLFYHGFVSSSANVYSEQNITKMVPQIDIALSDKYYRLLKNQNAFDVYPAFKTPIEKLYEYDSLAAVGGAAVGSEDINLENDYLNTYYESFPLEDGSIFVQKDFLFISFEEAHVDFAKNNFILEVYEIDEFTGKDNTEQLNRLIFSDRSGYESISSKAIDTYFDIEFDAEINKLLACALIHKDKELQTKNIYNTKVFNCEGIVAANELQAGNVYGQEPVEVEDVC